VLSILSRAKRSGFSALVFAVDTMLIGLRPFDLDTASFSCFHGVRTQIGLTDSVFMFKSIGMEPFPEGEKPDFPYIAARQDGLIRDGDKASADRTRGGRAFVGETLDPTEVWYNPPTS